jgi:hypothetical protein
MISSFFWAIELIEASISRRKLSVGITGFENCEKQELKYFMEKLRYNWLMN